MFEEYRFRKSNRLAQFDYSQYGWYFVTACVEEMKEVFGEVRNGEMTINENGKIAQRYWHEIPEHYEGVGLDEFVVMPNHVHGIIVIRDTDNGVGAHSVRPPRAINDRPYVDSILATIAWFNLFDYPLTAWEAGKWMIAFNGSDRSRPVITAGSYIDVLTALQNFVDKNILESKWSFFFLPGREEIVETRRMRYLLAREKFKKARRVAKWFRFVPFVRLVAVCNTLGYSNAAEESDIDLFIVTSPGKIWTVRALCLTLLQLFHLRPRLKRFGAAREERRDKIDLSFFVTEDALDLSSLSLRKEFPISNFQFPNKPRCPNSNDQNQSLFPNNCFPTDPYLMYWLVQLTPLWDHGWVYQKFWDANESLRVFLPHAGPYATSPVRLVTSSRLAQLAQRITEFVFHGSWVETVLRSLQYKKMPARIKDVAGKGVVLSDIVLKFHDEDRREEYRRRWFDKLHEYGVVG